MDMAKLFSLEGKVALVTGGSRGIGKMIAEGYLAQGAKVYISSRKAEVCDAVAEELGPMCISIPQDVSTLEGCRELAQKFSELEPQLDILVNNAGAAWGMPFEEFSEHGWDKVMNLNLKSPFFLIQAFHQPLAAAASQAVPAKVINIASIDGQRPSFWETYSYQASKSALIFLTKRLAARLVAEHIYVTAIAPGAFPTAINRDAIDNAEAVAAWIPAGRVGEPEDIAGAAVFLASNAGNYVIGDTLTVDGGVVHAAVPNSPEI